MRIVIIGPGRLGRSLHTLWGDLGHTVTLLGRNGTLPPCDVAVLTVPDAAITDAVGRVPAGVVALHTSGARDLTPMRPHRPAGSLHPLMTFPGPEVALPTLTAVPAALAGDPAAVAVARQLASDLGMSPFEVPGDRRLYHAAAVLAGNGAAILLAEAASLLAAAGVPPAACPAILRPLALASVQNMSGDLGATLTGPVARGDEQTLQEHRAALDEHRLSDTLPLYDALIQRARAHLAEDQTEDSDEA